MPRYSSVGLIWSNGTRSDHIITRASWVSSKWRTNGF